MITFKAKTATGEIIKSALSPFTFPAGEAHTKREEQRELEPTEIAIIQPSADSIHDDLFQLAMWNDYVVGSLVAPTATKRVLILPYVPGARADRGTPWGAEVYTEFINRLELDQVIIFDPHSPVVVQLLDDWTEDSLTVVHSDELWEQFLLQMTLTHYTGIIAPDKGAVERATAMADLAKLPVFTATKHRDEATGKLSGFAIDGLDPEGRYLIVDDICDGGGTFLGLAEASGLGYGHIDLYVSHGVFSKDALYNLKQKFEFIFTTNSYNPTRVLNDHGDFGDEDAHEAYRRFDVIRLLLSKIN